MEKIVITILEFVGYAIGRAAVWLFWMTFWSIRRGFQVFIIGPKEHVPEVETRLTHTHIVANSGFGKTQLLQNYICHDLPKIAAGSRSIIVIDSQGDFIGKILRLQKLSPDNPGLSERL